MFTILFVMACWATYVKCFEKGVQQSGHQLKAASPIKCPAQFRRALDGKENIRAKDWIESMPDDVLRWTALNLLAELGLPTEINTGAAIARRMEQAS